MKIASGIDIVEVARIKKLVKNKFLDKILSDEEKKYIGQKLDDGDRVSKCHSIAGLFAAKEAVLKALGVGVLNGISLKDVEIGHDLDNKPYLTSVKKIEDHLGVGFECCISISHESQYAVAIAIIEYK